MRVLAAAGFACLVLLGTGCGGGESVHDETTTTSTAAPTGEFGSYPADASLDERDVVEAYVRALDARDGKAFCRIVATWISGRFDIAGTDPDASLSRPVRCPQVVPGLTDFPWENQERDFKGASIADVGDLDERGDDLVGVPVTITLRLEEDERGVYDERLEDVVWLTKDAGAWRVAKLSILAEWAALTDGSEAELTSPPDVQAERRAFAVEVAKAQELRSAREASYRVVRTSATCPDGKTYPDGSDDVVDYRHPAPPTPTPQLPAADIRVVHVHASGRRICVLLELAGPVQTGTVFDFAIQSPDFEWGLVRLRPRVRGGAARRRPRSCDERPRRPAPPDLRPRRDRARRKPSHARGRRRIVLDRPPVSRGRDVLRPAHAVQASRERHGRSQRGAPSARRPRPGAARGNPALPLPVAAYRFCAQ